MDRWSRRQVVQGVGVAGLGLLVGCGRLPGQAQAASKVYRIGRLSDGPGESFSPPPPGLVPPADAFRQALAEYGWVEGHNLIIEWRSTSGGTTRYRALVADLLALPVDLLVTQAVPPTLAAKQVTGTIPIVFSVGADPVTVGLVNNLGRPGGNLTGVTSLAQQLSVKRLELLRDSIPGLLGVAVLTQPSNPGGAAQFQETMSAAQTLGLELVPLAVESREDIERAFEIAMRERVGAVVALDVPPLNIYRAQLVALADACRLPAMYPVAEAARSGGLMTYAASQVAAGRRVAYYVDRILKGAKPADLPVEQPREFEFIINLRTAQALGLTIPQHVLLQATEVLQ